MGRNVSQTRIIVVVAVATVAKLLLALNTVGTNDVGRFYRFGVLIRDHGLGEMYRADPAFNHLPLTALLCVIAVPLPWFPFWIRLPGIAADIVTVTALLRGTDRGQVPGWAIAVFAASPVALLVSGFHGNVDPVLTMALVLATLAAANGRPAASGGWLALAVNVKVAALVLAPLLIVQWWRSGGLRRAIPAFAGLTLLGWLPALVVAPREFVHQVLGYSGQWGTWGLSYLASRFGGSSFRMLPGFAQLTPVESTVVTALKVLIVAAILALALRHRTADASSLWRRAALTWIAFFALAPGIGAQYLVWLAPFVLMASPAAYVALTAASTVGLLAFYGATSDWDFYFAHSTVLVDHEWLPWMGLPWLAVVGIGISLVRRPPTDASVMGLAEHG